MHGQLRDEWLRDASNEHASVASFARFSLELMAIGAPASFVAEAHEAALDEIEHARICYSLAAHYGGEPLGPAPLRLDGLVVRSSLAEVAAAAAREACCAETFAALVVERAREGCTDTVVSSALERIASDEARHAELGWRFVAWALAAGGAEVREAVCRGFDEGLEALQHEGADDTVLGPGRLSGRELTQAARDAREIIGSCLPLLDLA